MPIGRQFYAGGPASVSVLEIVPAPGFCVLYSVEAQQLTAPPPGESRFLQIFDRPAAPVLGSVPLYSYLLGTNQLLAVQLPSPTDDQGRVIATQAWAAWSTTQATYTAAGALGPITASGRNLL